MRQAAEKMWRDIAAGTIDDAAALDWVRSVAREIVDTVLDAEFDGSNRRPDASLKAIGLAGQPDKHAALKSLITKQDKIYRWAGCRLRDLQMVGQLRQLGYDFEGLNDEQAAKLVHAQRKK